MAHVDADDFCVKQSFDLQSSSGTRHVPSGAVFFREISPLTSTGSVPSVQTLEKPRDLLTRTFPVQLVYRCGREALEELIKTGSPGKCFLYLSTTGFTIGGKRTKRVADRHDMESIKHDDCLPRLVDAVISGRPEQHMIETWRTLLPNERQHAEDGLGHHPQQLQRFWSPSKLEGNKLVQVSAGSEEYRHVEEIFKATPSGSCYVSNATPPLHVEKIERIENAGIEGQVLGGYDAIKRSLQEQDMQFKSGTHVRWLWHGTSSYGIKSIINDPAAGFSTLFCGTSVGNVWGKGLYFARDAAYCKPYCEELDDGRRQVILCLVVVGLPTLGCITYSRQYPKISVAGTERRYHSLVDSLSNPEIFVVRKDNQVYPAFVVTYSQ